MKRNKSGIIFLIALMLALIMTVPIAGAVESNGIFGTKIEKNITLNIEFPDEGGYIFSDVIGSPVTIYVQAESVNGIKNVSITNGINQSVCRYKYSDYSCFNPSQIGKNSVTVTAFDNSGSSISKTRNYSFDIGQMPPPTTNPSIQNTSLPGFEFPIGILAFLIGLVILQVQGRR